VKSEAYLMDCMEYMKGFPDKFFELAVVDPPYGIKINMNQGRRAGQELKHDKKEWDNEAPKETYFKELERVSKKQIIWGANNFSLISNGWIVWDKDITGDVQFSKCEMAYTNFLGSIDLVKIRAQTGAEAYSNKIHPTQKPIALYKWLLSKYAKPGDKILDTHLGSGSSRIDAWDLGFDFYATELDPDYFKAQEERFNLHKSQGTLFDPVELQKEKQVDLDII